MVTGGAGFIGSHIVEELVLNGCEVHILDNLSTGSRLNILPREEIRFFQGDIRDFNAVRHATNGCEVVFHEAAIVSAPFTVKNPVESAHINELGTVNVLEAARISGVRRVVLASSCAVYGDTPEIPKNENIVPEPISPYAVQKISGELYARLYFELYGMETVSLRYFNVYGPRQDPSSPYSGVISIFLTRALSGKRPVIYGDGEQYRDFVYVKDVVMANLLAANSVKLPGSALNVGAGTKVSVNSLWNTICRIANIDLSPRYEPTRMGDIKYSLSDISQIQKAFGFQPRYSLDEGLNNTFLWYKKHYEKNV